MHLSRTQARSVALLSLAITFSLFLISLREVIVTTTSVHSKNSYTPSNNTNNNNQFFLNANSNSNATRTITTTSSSSTKPKRFAVARTFCEADCMDLFDSFSVWDEYFPCNTEEIKNNPNRPPVDLIISFSQFLGDSKKAWKAVQKVEELFHQKKGWGGCFDKFVYFDCKIPPDKDLYKPKLQGINVNWVNGPNRQFEKTIREIIKYGKDNDNGDYELMYLMEGDSMPLKPYWLDAFTQEIEEKRPFSTLGSGYIGDKWDSFFNKMPAALIHHTNGNAVYNITHPLFLNLLGELEDEWNTPANNIAFDHRMQQIVQEGIIGKPSQQEDFPDVPEMPNKTSMFQQWIDEYPPEEYIKESSINGNYAATNMLRELVNPDMYVIHGAKMYETWNATKYGEVTLVVSDWEEGNSRTLIGAMDKSRHPYSEVLVLQPESSKTNNTLESMTINSARIRHHYRDGANEPDFMDFCSAPVETDWFMITNSYFWLRPIVTLMVNENKAKGGFTIVVSTVEADKQTCWPFKSCAQDMKIAKHFYPNMKNIFQSDNMLFKTSLRNKFCEELKLLPESKKLISTPATAYMAHIESEVDGGIDSIYKLSDRRKHGSRFHFIPLHEDKLPPIMAEQHRRNLQLHKKKKGNRILLSNINITDCTGLVTEAECASKGCLWRSDFGSCYSPPLHDDDYSPPPDDDNETLDIKNKKFPSVTDLNVTNVNVTVLNVTVLNVTSPPNGTKSNSSSMTPSTTPSMMPSTAPTTTPSSAPTIVPSTTPTVAPTDPFIYRGPSDWDKKNSSSMMPSTTPSMMPSPTPTTTSTMTPSSSPFTVPNITTPDPMLYRDTSDSDKIKGCNEAQSHGFADLSKRIGDIDDRADLSNRIGYVSSDYDINNATTTNPTTYRYLRESISNANGRNCEEDNHKPTTEDKPLFGQVEVGNGALLSDRIGDFEEVHKDIIEIQMH